MIDCRYEIILKSAYLWGFVDMFQLNLLLGSMCES